MKTAALLALLVCAAHAGPEKAVDGVPDAGAPLAPAQSGAAALPAVQDPTSGMPAQLDVPDSKVAAAGVEAAGTPAAEQVQEAATLPEGAATEIPGAGEAGAEEAQGGPGFIRHARAMGASLMDRLRGAEDQLGPSYMVKAGGHSIGIKRIEYLDGVPVEIWDASAYIRERRSKSEPDLKIFDLNQLFAKPTPFLGFGIPNVFLGFPHGEGVSKIAAKSLWRGDTHVVDTKGRVQSGVFLVFRDLDPEAIRMRDIAQRREGSRQPTCVHENCVAMGEMGFTIGGKPISDFYMPMPLLKAIVLNSKNGVSTQDGLLFNGKPVAFDLVRTTPKRLENFRRAVDWAVKTTPIRHLRRRYGEDIPEDEPTAPVRDITRYPLDGFSSDDLELTASQPSRFGKRVREIGGEHTLYRVRQRRVNVNDYLPTPLDPFPQKDPDFVTRLKKGVLFTREKVAKFVSHLAKEQPEFERRSDKDIFEMMETDSESSPNKYNLVVEGSDLLVMRTTGKDQFKGLKRWIAKKLDWILSKHVLMANYSENVRFAGEVWKARGADGKVRIYVSNNSGTYKPTLAQLQKAVEYLQKIFPGVEIVGVPAGAND